MGKDYSSVSNLFISRPVTRSSLSNPASISSKSSVMSHDFKQKLNGTHSKDREHHATVPDADQKGYLNITSSDYHSAPPSQEDSKENTLLLLSPNTDSDTSAKLPSMFHETHFGESDLENPTTIVHKSKPVLVTPSLSIYDPGLSDLDTDRISLYSQGQPSGLSIFDCEMECFVPIKEYKDKVRERRKKI